MLALQDIVLKQTLFYQEIADEERQKESMKLLPRQLRHKFGLQPALEQTLLCLPDFSLATLEDLADALLDFDNLTDLKSWLSLH